MRTPKFKVGDKVRVICNSTEFFIVQKAMNEVGVISSMKDMIYIQFNKNIWQGLTVIGFFESEIEKVVTKGQQLLFDFMR